MVIIKLLSRYIQTLFVYTCDLYIHKSEKLLAKRQLSSSDSNALLSFLNCIKLKFEVVEPNVTDRRKTVKLSLDMLTLYLSDSDQL